MKPRYLTKSKFQMAMECPTKLYYCDKPEYSNLKSSDAFLQALAESGFQVAELAKAYYPEGISIETLNDEQAIAETLELLKRDQVVIFEAAIRHENLFVRVDILIKNNDHLTIIEVKSKTIGQKDKVPFFTTKGEKAIRSDWKSYVFDAAFQKHVLLKVFPTYRISTYLMLVDKQTTCPTSGLNQKFHIKKDESGRVKVIRTCELIEEELSQKILRKVNVSEEIELIFRQMKFNETQSFADYVNYLSEKYIVDEKIPPVLGKHCKKCEFKTNVKNLKLKSGFQECWSEVCGLKENEPTVLDVWKFRDADDLIKQGIYQIHQLSEEDIKPEKEIEVGLTENQRRWKQVEKVINHDNTEWIDVEGLRDEMNSWTYPLHFIDFETAMPAIPFNKGERPCLGLAFQFSHHVMFEDGRVEHAGQYINEKIGINPNLDFIRALKNELDKDEGTIFRYSPHENSYLNTIHDQLQLSDVPDRQELISFIEQISQPTDANKGKWEIGPRNMVDLWDLVKKFYYDPLTNGSNSIKKVFPAILSRSEFLQNKYGKPIYGVDSGIKSLNFKNWQWIKKEDNKIIDPYDLLPKLFSELDINEDQLDLLFHDDKLKEGGSASIAYARMQFSEMSDAERSELRNALLKYCELDTLAMVMVVEGWKNILFRNQ
jgi:hypothetical protein